MLSTCLEAAGLALITAGTTAGTLVLLGLGAALLVFGLVGGMALAFVGYALGQPDVPPRRVRVRKLRVSSNEHAERV